LTILQMLPLLVVGTGPDPWRFNRCDNSIFSWQVILTVYGSGGFAVI
jgi:hypothetical protein